LIADEMQQILTIYITGECCIRNNTIIMDTRIISLSNTYINFYRKNVFIATTSLRYNTTEVE